MQTTTVPTGQQMSSGPSGARYAFPGPWSGGLSLMLAPLALLAGALLRVQFHFFFPDQLTAYAHHPALMSAAYGTFFAGIVMLMPAVCAVAGMVGRSRPMLATWGGAMVLVGLAARAFHYGANAFAFSLVDSRGTEMATRAVGDFYGMPDIVPSSLSLCVLAGWLVLSAGCALSRTLHWAPAIALALTAGLEIGVLKGTTWISLVAIAGLAVAFVPLGWRTLRAAPRPGRRTALTTLGLVGGLAAASIVFGQLG